MKWVYMMPADEPNWMVRERHQIVQDMQRERMLTVVAAINGLASDKVQSSSPVITTSEALQSSDCTIFIMANQQSAFSAAQSTCSVILHPLTNEDDDSIIQRQYRVLECEAWGWRLSSHFFYRGEGKVGNRLAVYGDGSARLAAQFMASGIGAEIADVHIDGHELELARDYQAAACVFIDQRVPSPRIFLEAMAGGGVIVTTTDSVTFCVSHGINAWVVDRANILDALKWLMLPEQRDLCAGLREGALATAWSYHERTRKVSLRKHLEQLIKNP